MAIHSYTTLRDNTPSMKENVCLKKEKTTLVLPQWFAEQKKEEPLNVDALSQKKVEALDFNHASLTAAHVSKIIGSFENFERLNALYFEEVDFTIHEELFNALEKSLLEREYSHTLYVKKAFLTEEQWQTLRRLCNTNKLKGLQVYAVDYPQGVVPGYFYMNQSRYNEAKVYIADYQLRWTLQATLSRYFPSLTIKSVFDFGAGLSPELLFLSRHAAQLEKMVAADFDEGQLKLLRERLQSPYNLLLETYVGPFVKYEGTSKFELFLSSFTFPYRSPDQFPEVWKKAVSMTASGGIMAFHLFGKPKIPHEELTYHTLDEIKELLKPICTEFQIIAENPDGSCEFIYWSQPKGVHSRKPIQFNPADFKRTGIYGGDEPEWGTLYHVIAQRDRLSADDS